ncbi:MAG: hypothetical protein QXN68_03450 [Thermoplasmata archaeon]
MFAMLLNTEQRKEFIKLVYYLAKCDNYIHQKEKELIEHYLYETMLSPDDVVMDEDSIDFEKLRNIFNESRARKIVLIELVTLASIDMNLSSDEYDFILKLSEVFEIERKELDKFIEFGKRLVKIIEEANSLINK